MRLSLFLGLILLLAGCNKCPPPFDPEFCFVPPQPLINALPSPFNALGRDELQTLWGKELYLGTKFSAEGDWYRAITAYKSSLFLLPKKEIYRKQQLEFSLFLCYYLACKHKDALQVYESSTLVFPEEAFPAKKELSLALWDCYEKTNQSPKADLIQEELPCEDQEDLTLSRLIQKGDVVGLAAYTDQPAIETLRSDYFSDMKSPRRAEMLQTILPGAGYFYVGLEKAAVTSFVINALFIAAAVEFWHHGYYAASLITFSLETGWYFGGINGAGIAANEYNKRLYEGIGKESLIEQKLFPVLKFEFAF